MLALDPGLIGIIFGVLALHWALSLLALYRLFMLRPGKAAAILLNLMIVLAVIVGSVGFLIWFAASGREREMKQTLRAARAAAEGKSGEGGEKASDRADAAAPGREPDLRVSGETEEDRQDSGRES